MRPWYCAQTQPNKEFEARKQLERQGFVAFLPAYLVKDKFRHIRLKLLFKNYIFVSLDDPILWPRVQRTIGISRVITSSGIDSEDQQPWYAMPSQVASNDIESLRTQSLAFDEVRKDGPQKPPDRIISEGCHVRVLTGIFRDEACAQKALVDWADGDRVGLLLDIFNRKVSVEFYHKDVKLVE